MQKFYPIYNYFQFSSRVSLFFDKKSSNYINELDTSNERNSNYNQSEFRNGLFHVHVESENIEDRLRSNDFLNIITEYQKSRNVKTIFDFLSSWKSNFTNLTIPPLSEPLENSIRLNNLIWFIQLSKPKLNFEQEKEILRMIKLFANLIYLFCETHLNNNHPLIESKNLLLAGLVFSDIKYSKKWKKRGEKILTDCLEKQIDKNGVHIERSTMYQKVVFSELLELSAFVTKYPDAVSPGFKQLLWKKLELMAQYDHVMTFDSGYYPLWGDGYISDRLIRFVPVYCNNGEYSPHEQNINFWSDCLNIKDFGYQKVKSCSLINRSGFVYSRSGGITLIMNTGTNLSKQKFAKGHLHSDLLSFVLFKDGKELIANAGTFDYTKESIPYFRGTRGHNTIMINDFEQHGWQDKSQAGHYADGFVDLVEEKNGFHYIAVHHDGYDRIGVSHKRNMAHDLKKKTITITDRIEATGDHPFEYAIHFAPGVECAFSGNKILMEDTGVMEFDIPENSSTKLFYGDEHPGAWCSRSLMIKEPIYIFIIKGYLKNSAEIKIYFSLTV